MRRVVGYVLIGFGVLFASLAPLLHFYAAPRLAVAPLACTGESAICQDGVNLSPSSGVAATLFDPATLTETHAVPVVGMERVRADVAASTGGSQHLTVYDESQILTHSNGDLINATTMRIPFDGHSSQMIDCCNANTNGTPISDFTGLNPLKLGFGTKQQTYQYFDKTLGQALPMEFQQVETIDGVECYKFVQTIEPTENGSLEVPGDLVGSSKPSVTAPEFYANVRTLWVEPTTGVIVKGVEQQKTTLRGADGVDRVTLIDATIAFTDANVAASAALASDGKGKLDMLSTTLPIVSVVLGVILLVGGLLWLRRGSGGSASDAHATAAQPQAAA